MLLTLLEIQLPFKEWAIPLDPGPVRLNFKGFGPFSEEFETGSASTTLDTDALTALASRKMLFR